MRNTHRLAALTAASILPLAALAGPPLEDITGPASGDGPALSWSQEKFANDGYADRSRVNAAKAGARTMALSEEGPNDSAVGLVIDPISGEILSGKKK